MYIDAGVDETVRRDGSTRQLNEAVKNELWRDTSLMTTLEIPATIRLV